MVTRDDFDLAQLPELNAKIEAEYNKFRLNQKNVLDLMEQRYSDDYMVDRPCPLCSDEGFSVKFVKSGLVIVTCNTCAMEYSRNVLSVEQDKSYYEDDPAEFNPALSKLRQHSVYRELDLRRATYLLTKLNLPSGSKLLDIGSGHGVLLEVAKGMRLRATGVELSPVIAEDCHKRGLDVVIGEFPDAIKPGEKYDAVIMLDVLEHMTDPLVTLSQVKKVLAKNATLLVQVPNMASLLVAIEGEDNSNYGYGHWSYFTPKSLRSLIEKAGFSVTCLETYVSEIHRIKTKPGSDINRALDDLGVRDLEAQALSPSDIFENDLGYKLCILATA